MRARIVPQFLNRSNMQLLNVEILSIGEIKEFGPNNFKVLEFVVLDDTNPDYPQEILLQATGERAEKMKEYNKVGQRVDCSINIKGRKYEPADGGPTRWYNTIECWKCFKAEAAGMPEL